MNENRTSRPCKAPTTNELSLEKVWLKRLPIPPVQNFEIRDRMNFPLRRSGMADLVGMLLVPHDPSRYSHIGMALGKSFKLFDLPGWVLVFFGRGHFADQTVLVP